MRPFDQHRQYSLALENPPLLIAAPRRHPALVCFVHQAWRDTLDQAVDMYGKLRVAP